jgi:hypothetical protein
MGSQGVESGLRRSTMRAMRTFMLIALAAAALAACGNGDPAIPILYPDMYVDPIAGDDSNDGSYVLPYKTIKAAMANATRGDIIQAEPGTYDAANGEAFPIRVVNGVTLVGNEAARGEGPVKTVIEGMGSFNLLGDEAAVVLGEDSTIAGFLISTNTLSIDTGAVYVNTTGVTVRNNTLTGSHWGIFSDSGPDTVRVQGNIIKSNEYGVDLRHIGMDLGGGPAGSAGRNQISCNTQNDVYMAVNNPGNPAYAMNNYWDHTPPSVSETSSPGLDIYIKYTGNTIETTGANLSPGFCAP